MGDILSRVIGVAKSYDVMSRIKNSRYHLERLNYLDVDVEPIIDLPKLIEHIDLNHSHFDGPESRNYWLWIKDHLQHLTSQDILSGFTFGFVQDDIDVTRFGDLEPRTKITTYLSITTRPAEARIF